MVADLLLNYLLYISDFWKNVAFSEFTSGRQKMKKKPSDPLSVYLVRVFFS